MAVSSRRGEQGKVQRTTAAPDPDEQAALDKAAEALRTSNGDARQAAERCITAWIMERSLRAAKARSSSEVAVRSLGEGHAMGVAEAALPAILAALPDSFPWEGSLMTLSKQDAATMFAAAYRAIGEQFVRMNEKPEFPFDDEIPF